jgi:hypothetical protein
MIQILPQPLLDVIVADELTQRAAALGKSCLKVEQALTDVFLDGFVHVLAYLRNDSLGDRFLHRFSGLLSPKGVI